MTKFYAVAEYSHKQVDPIILGGRFYLKLEEAENAQTEFGGGFIMHFDTEKRLG